MIIIALSSFTDAAKNLLGLIVSETRPTTNGEWIAEIIYPSNKNKYTEVFSFKGNGNTLHGTASYIGNEQVIINGMINDNHIEFITKTIEYSPDWNNDQRKIATHQYSGKFLDNEIEFVLESYGGFSTDSPIRFIAKRKPNKHLNTDAAEKRGSG